MTETRALSVEEARWRRVQTAILVQPNAMGLTADEAEAIARVAVHALDAERARLSEPTPLDVAALQGALRQQIGATALHLDYDAIRTALQAEPKP